MLPPGGCRSSPFRLLYPDAFSLGQQEQSPAHFLFRRSEVKGPRCSRSGAGRALLGPRHRNSKTGKLCSGMWLRFKDWYLQKGAEIRFNRTKKQKVLVPSVRKLPFGTPVVVIALNGSGGLLETDVVETCKGGAADVFDGVIGDQELFLGAAGQEEG